MSGNEIRVRYCLDMPQMSVNLVSDNELQAVYRLDTPLDFQIIVQGNLGDDWEHYFEMEVTCEISANGIPFSIFTGRVADQAALVGILNNLYGFGLTLLYVACVPSVDEPGGTTRSSTS